jgi:hypothetical protein
MNAEEFSIKIEFGTAFALGLRHPRGLKNRREEALNPSD